MPGPVERWLETFMCKQYADMFEAYGYKTLQSVCQLEIPQLQAMGVAPEHCEKIVENVCVLRQTLMGSMGGQYEDSGNSFMSNSSHMQPGMSYGQQDMNQMQQQHMASHNASPYQQGGGHNYQGQGQMMAPPQPQYGNPAGQGYMQQPANQTQHSYGNQTGGFVPPYSSSHYSGGGNHCNSMNSMGTGMNSGGMNTMNNIPSPRMSSGINSNMNNMSGGPNSQMSGNNMYYNSMQNNMPNNVPNMPSSIPSNVPTSVPMHHHMRNAQNPQNPQQVADTILQMTAGSNYQNNMPGPGPGPLHVNKYRSPHRVQQHPQQHGHMMHTQMNPSQHHMVMQHSPNHMGMRPNNQFVYPNQSPMHPSTSPMHPNASPMHPGASPMHPGASPMHPGASPMHPGASPMHPGASPMHQPTRTSPMSPMQVRSPASVHSNHSMHCASPGPVRSPAPGSERSPVSVASPGIASMRSPTGVQQQIHSPANLPHSMRSPVHNIQPISSPAGSQGSHSSHHSPATSMKSPSHPGQGHFSPTSMPMHSPQQQLQQSEQHCSPSSYPQPQYSQQQQHCPTPQSTTVSYMNTHTSTPGAYTNSLESSSSQNAQSNKPSIISLSNPLQSLQKLVMLPESQVVDPKSVVNDACLPGMSTEGNPKNLNSSDSGELESERASNQTACADGKHCGSDVDSQEQEANNLPPPVKTANPVKMEPTDCDSISKHDESIEQCANVTSKHSVQNMSTNVEKETVVPIPINKNGNNNKINSDNLDSLSNNDQTDRSVKNKDEKRKLSSGKTGISPEAEDIPTSHAISEASGNTVTFDEKSTDGCRSQEDCRKVTDAKKLLEPKSDGTNSLKNTVKDAKAGKNVETKNHDTKSLIDNHKDTKPEKLLETDIDDSKVLNDNSEDKKSKTLLEAKNETCDQIASNCEKSEMSVETSESEVKSRDLKADAEDGVKIEPANYKSQTLTNGPMSNHVESEVKVEKISGTSTKTPKPDKAVPVKPVRVSPRQAALKQEREKQAERESLEKEVKNLQSAPKKNVLPHTNKNKKATGIDDDQMQNANGDVNHKLDVFSDVIESQENNEILKDIKSDKILEKNEKSIVSAASERKARKRKQVERNDFICTPEKKRSPEKTGKNKIENLSPVDKLKNESDKISSENYFVDGECSPDPTTCNDVVSETHNNVFDKTTSQSPRRSARSPSRSPRINNTSPIASRKVSPRRNSFGKEEIHKFSAFENNKVCKKENKVANSLLTTHDGVPLPLKGNMKNAYLDNNLEEEVYSATIEPVKSPVKRKKRKAKDDLLGFDTISNTKSVRQRKRPKSPKLFVDFDDYESDDEEDDPPKVTKTGKKKKPKNMAKKDNLNNKKNKKQSQNNDAVVDYSSVKSKSTTSDTYNLPEKSKDCLHFKSLEKSLNYSAERLHKHSLKKETDSVHADNDKINEIPDDLEDKNSVIELDDDSASSSSKPNDKETTELALVKKDSVKIETMDNDSCSLPEEKAIESIETSSSNLPLKMELGDSGIPAGKYENRTESVKKKMGRPKGSKTKFRHPKKNKMETFSFDNSSEIHCFKSMKFNKTLETLSTSSSSTKKKKIAPVRAPQGPVIKLKGKATYEVVNIPVCYEKESESRSKKRKSSKLMHGDKALTPSSYNLDNSAPWLCALCGRGTTHKSLGDLFGPYYLEGQSPVKSDTPKPEEKEKRKRKKNSKFEDSDEWNTDSKRKRSKKDKEMHVSIPSTSRDSSEDVIGEVWLHEDCVIWSHGVYLAGHKLHGLEEMLSVAKQTTCSACKTTGATLGCFRKGCNLNYHYLCAVEKDCLLDEENFSLVCAKHKDKKVKMVGPRSSSLT